MALAQSLGMPAKVYYNHYNSNNPTLIRYRIEFYPDNKLIEYIACEKKRNNYTESFSERNHQISTVVSVNKVQKNDYSYDVETDSSHFEVSGVYSHNCRAFLSPWYERGGMESADENDKAVFEGRFNLGVVSLHLPMILAKSRNESKDFWEVLDYYLEMIRNLHKRTYDYIGEIKASVNPVAFCEGGLYGGTLKPTDKIKSILKPMTLSFGITALNELQELYNGKSIIEDGEFALEVMKYINKKINQFKEEDKLLYAIYGTPAESLCGLQVQQFRKQYGIIENVSDREYVSNSFHCHVSEDITPIEKQDYEERFWNYFNGGKIQYCRYPVNYNKEAVVTLIRRAMKKGFYEGVNLSLAYCEHCGHEELNMSECPVCGSKDITKIDRMNGYLGFTRVHGDTRYNEAKNAEIRDRKSM
ncbi:anaerobic ribonucleoside-triphosphate reductase [Mediterraneibacter sp. NSJ-55]|uniref:Anaerobic ribonucleoside-triphosphate reductase n=2 Tax=Mediterraneibacter hominis TaxID=2763054 RepID=A0A923LGA0_9FIRM|nr:anaerobic ribonucleoside-triphosphate reductase [Mediterraneibacter hominis]